MLNKNNHEKQLELNALREILDFKLFIILYLLLQAERCRQITVKLSSKLGAFGLWNMPTIYAYIIIQLLSAFGCSKLQLKTFVTILIHLPHAEN